MITNSDNNVYSFFPKQEILIVNRDGNHNIKPNEIEVGLIGQKAYGLCCLPPKWTLPFFIISADLLYDYKQVSDSERDSILKNWVKNIKDATFATGINDEDYIIRSSGCEEDLADRGKYYSEQGNNNNIFETVKHCLDKLVLDQDTTDKRIPLIYQKFIAAKEKGHLSNERRLCREPRDWVGEFEINPKPFRIAFRYWRTEENKEKVDRSLIVPLSCDSKINIINALRIVVAWIFYIKALRVHFEWVWDGRNIFLVQADTEKKREGVNPKIKKQEVKKNNFQFQCLGVINDELAKKYSKVRNVHLYSELGLHTADLYILDKKEEIGKLAIGECSHALAHDLEHLIKNPLVIRMDIDSKDKEKYQFLPRKEFRDFNQALDWLKHNAADFKEKYDEDFIFLFHNFIPASAAAFAYAEPNRRVVYIEALWGLPEGLYYNANDKYTVDTKNSDFTKLDRNSFEIIKKENFKDFFIAPDKDGKWVRQRLSEKFNWKGSIEKDEWINEIAYVSRMIAEKENKSLSIMWFIDVGEHVCAKSVFPWFHEPYNYIKAENYKYRPKTVLDKAIKVQNISDLKKLELVPENERNLVKCILIQPNEDEALRDKSLLKKLGEIAKNINATILLEGGVLSHAYYQLIQTGASVEVFYPIADKEPKQEFNKLVRDKIPESIKDKGEKVYVYNLQGDDFLLALRHKLIEESFEVLDAIEPETILAELADVSEVIDGILHFLKLDKNTLTQQQKRKRDKAGGFEQGIVLSETKKPLSIEKKDKGLISSGIDVEYKIQKYESGMNISKWNDKREHLDTTEFITRILVPFMKDNWTVDFTRGTTRSMFGNDLIILVKGKRIGAKGQIELSIYKKKKRQISFFDD